MTIQHNPNIKTLKISAKFFGTELPKGNVPTASKALREFFIDEFGEENLVSCQICGNEAPERDKDDKLLNSCPYCGVGFMDKPAEEVKPKKEIKPATKKGAKKSTKKITKKTTKKKAVKTTKEESTEIEVSKEQMDKLAVHVEKIKNLRASFAETAWDIGQELIKIHDNALWKGMGYKSFFAFVQGELDISRSGAYKYMTCARTFKREIFQKIGLKKGDLISSAPEEHRRKLINAAKKGFSHTQLKDRLDRLEGKSKAQVKKTTGLTLLGRIKEGDIVVQWLNQETHEQANETDELRYALMQITEEIELVLIPTEDGSGLICNFRRVEHDEPEELDENQEEMFKEESTE
jgi:chemotaxis protein histidine kinase CheA